MTWRLCLKSVKFLQVKWKRFRAGICTSRSWPMAATCLYCSQGRPRNPSRKARKRVSFTCLFEVDEQWVAEEGRVEGIKGEIHSVCGLGNSHVIGPLNKIQQQWENKKLSGHQDFKDVISRDDFQIIWCTTKFHLPDYDNELARVSQISASEMEKIQSRNLYIKELTDGCYLSLWQPRKTKKSFQKNKEKGLFHLPVWSGWMMYWMRNP